MSRPSPAMWGWAAIGGIVVAYDVWALRTNHETMSRFFWRHRDDPVSRYVGVGAWMGLTWHLLLGDKVLLPPSVHNHYLRLHPLWAANEAIRRRAIAVMAIVDDSPFEILELVD